MTGGVGHTPIQPAITPGATGVTPKGAPSTSVASGSPLSVTPPGLTRAEAPPPIPIKNVQNLQTAPENVGTGDHHVLMDHADQALAELEQEGAKPARQQDEDFAKTYENMSPEEQKEFNEALLALMQDVELTADQKTKIASFEGELDKAFGTDPELGLEREKGHVEEATTKAEVKEAEVKTPEPSAKPREERPSTSRRLRNAFDTMTRTMTIRRGRGALTDFEEETPVRLNDGGSSNTKFKEARKRESGGAFNPLDGNVKTYVEHAQELPVIGSLIPSSGSPELKAYKEAIKELAKSLKSISHFALSDKEVKEIVHRMILQTSLKTVGIENLSPEKIAQELEELSEKLSKQFGLPKDKCKEIIENIAKHAEWKITDMEPPKAPKIHKDDSEDGVKITIIPFSKPPPGGFKGKVELKKSITGIPENLTHPIEIEGTSAESYKSLIKQIEARRMEMLLHSLLNFPENIHLKDPDLMRKIAAGVKGMSEALSHHGLGASLALQDAGRAVDALGGGFSLLAAAVGFASVARGIATFNEIKTQMVQLREEANTIGVNTPQGKEKLEEANALEKELSHLSKKTTIEAFASANSAIGGTLTLTGVAIEALGLAETLSTVMVVAPIGVGFSVALEGIKTTIVEGKKLYKQCNQKEELKALKTESQAVLDNPKSSDKEKANAQMILDFANFQMRNINLKIVSSALGTSVGALTTGGGVALAATATVAAVTGAATMGTVPAVILGVAAGVAVTRVGVGMYLKHQYTEKQEALKKSDPEKSDLGILARLHTMVEAEQQLEEKDRVLTNKLVKGYLKIEEPGFFLNLVAPVAEQFK